MAHAGDGVSGSSEFRQGYISAIYFTDSGDAGQPDGLAPMEESTYEHVHKDCATFWRSCRALIESGDDGQSPEQAGHDFWLTRNGHGAGFWDGDWPVNGDTLYLIAKSYDEIHVYATCEGMLAFE
jgi:hypothetical protein